MKRDLELGTRMMTDLLSMLVRNVAIATMPKANQTRIRRVDLVAVQEALTLVVLVLQEARTRQRILRLAQDLTQDELTTIANKLTANYGGATRQKLKAQASDLSVVERQVLEATTQIMEEEDASRFEEPSLSGMRHLLHQPEFEANPRLRALVELLEDKAALKDILPKLLAGEEFRAVIGDENPQDEMQECSVIISRYGQTEGVGGLIAVIGPTRMEYRKSIGSVHLLSKLMSEMVKQVN
jgi:heat-inducible transcriptional repressor